MEQKTEYFKLKLLLGSIAFTIGLIASAFALVNWNQQITSNYVLGNYAGYVLAIGSFGSMFFGVMLVNDFLHLRHFATNRSVHCTTADSQISFIANLETEETLKVTNI